MTNHYALYDEHGESLQDAIQMTSAEAMRLNHRLSAVESTNRWKVVEDERDDHEGCDECMTYPCSCGAEEELQ